MKKVITGSLALAKSTTAKDTSILFAGNLLTAFLGFVLLLLLARAITVEQMGVFSAFTNLVLLLSAITDPGISSGLVKFIAESRAKRKFVLEKKYISAGLKIELVIFLVIAVLLLIFAKPTAKGLLATNNTSLVYILIFGVLAQTIWVFTSYTLRARRKFLRSAITDVIASTARLLGILIIITLPFLALSTATFAYSVGAVFALIFGFYFLGNSFILQKVSRKHYSSLMKFSSWLGVNKISSVLSGKIDIQMIALFAGATSTGFYSIPARLIFFVTILVASMSSVVAPRLAAMGNREKEKAYILKILLFSIIIVGGLIIWYITASPFITTLFGDKYLPSVPIFRLLIISMIPFVLTIPTVNAIIYSIKKPKHIGHFSIFQIIAVVFFNLIFIPSYGAIGATYTLIITNVLLAIYTWFIVIRQYFS